MMFDPVTKKIRINAGMDILLALLYAKGATGKQNESISGYTRLVKLMFLLFKESRLKNYIDHDYKFSPYDYGPYAPQIYNDLDIFEEKQLIETKILKKDSRIDEIDEFAMADFDAMADLDFEEDRSREIKIFKLSEKGLQLGKAIFETLTEEEQKQLINIKKIYNSMNLYNILEIIYSRYPETTTRSVIKQKMNSLCQTNL